MGLLKILIADDHTILRQGLGMLLKAEDGFIVVGEAENGREAVRKAAELKPDIVVMDIGMPLLNGVEATRQIRRENDSVRVLILSMHLDEEFVHRAMAAGASGYLVKHTASKDLVLAIQEISQGRTFFSTSIPRSAVNSYRTLRRNANVTVHKAHINELTQREREVLQLLAEGQSNKEVANELSISVKTVEKHRQQIYKKIGIHETAGITRYALAHGMIDLDVRK